MHLLNYFQSKHVAHTQTFYQSNWIWKVSGRLQFWIYATHQCTKLSRRETLCILTRNFQGRQNITILIPVFTLPLRILLKPWTVSLAKNTITAKILSQLKCLEERKKLRFTWQMRDLIFHSLVQIWGTFLEVRLVINLE